MSGDTPESPGFRSGFTVAERRAILRGSEAACATSTGLRETLMDLRTEAITLRRESVRLRDQARVVREGRQR